MITYADCIQLNVIFAIHAIRFIDFQQIENNWTNGTIYDFFVKKAILYQIQQGGVCTFSNLNWTREEDDDVVKENRFRINTLTKWLWNILSTDFFFRK